MSDEVIPVDDLKQDAIDIKNSEEKADDQENLEVSEDNKMEETEPSFVQAKPTEDDVSEVAGENDTETLVSLVPEEISTAQLEEGDVTMSNVSDVQIEGTSAEEITLEGINEQEEEITFFVESLPSDVSAEQTEETITLDQSITPEASEEQIDESRMKSEETIIQDKRSQKSMKTYDSLVIIGDNVVPQQEIEEKMKEEITFKESFDFTIIGLAKHEAESSEESIRGKTFQIPMIRPKLESVKNVLLCFCRRIRKGQCVLDLQGHQFQTCFGRRIRNYDLEDIVEFLTLNPRIISCNLSYNQIDERGLFELFYFLAGNKTLMALNLMQNNIRKLDKGTFMLLNYNKSLRDLRLNGNKFGPQGGIVLSEMLRENKTLKLLDIAETDLNLVSMVYLMDALKSKLGSNSTLNALDLSRLVPIQLNYKFESDRVADLVSQMLTNNTSLVELHLQKCQFTDWDVQVIMDGIVNHESLRLLDFSANEISSVGLERIAEILPNTNIQALMLGSNRITDIGAIALAKKIKCSNINLLDLSNNLIKDKGIIQLVNCKKKTPLLAFFITGNKLTNKCANVIYEALNSGSLQPNGIDIRLWWDNNDTLNIAHYTEVNSYRPKYFSVTHGKPDLVKTENRKLIKYLYHRFLSYAKPLSDKEICNTIKEIN